ncbi:MAG: LysM peptidoglycan-binding domain-containing protein [Clostridiales bacterium]|jgi:hypothetical protein|nr:LysM peptidoglycan-binding domain-containing protein [Clostridiales bacterium]
MPPDWETNEIGFRTAIQPTSHLIIPEAPLTCKGFLYAVQPGDTLHSITRRFRCSIHDVISANPHIRNGTIFVRQIICIPVIKVLPFKQFFPLAPRVLFKEFFGPFGETLPVANGSVQLAARTFIRVIFSRPVIQAFFFLAPSGTLTFLPGQLIGVETLVPKQRVARFVWDVPAGTRGSLFIVGCNEFVCGPPNETEVRRI